jgi:Mn-dependent DtxR family transcriptional regulator
MDKDPEMTTRVDREILVALLLGGADTPKNLSSITDRHVQSVYERLTQLSKENLIWNKGNGVYQLTEEGTSMAQAVLREYDIVSGLDFEEP